MEIRIRPLSHEEMDQAMTTVGRVQGIIPIDLETVVSMDRGEFLRFLSLKLTGSTKLHDMVFALVGHHMDTLYIEVTGNAAAILLT